jgi:hypothetical protein
MLLHLGQRLADSNGTGRVKFFTQRQSLHRHRIERSSSASAIDLVRVAENVCVYRPFTIAKIG